MSCDRRLFHETFYTNVEGRLIFGHETIIETRVAGFDCLKNTPVDEPCKAQKFQEYLASLEQADCRNLSIASASTYADERTREIACGGKSTHTDKISVLEYLFSDNFTVDDDDVEELEDSASLTCSETDDGKDESADGSFTTDPAAFSPATSNEGSLGDVKGWTVI